MDLDILFTLIKNGPHWLLVIRDKDFLNTCITLAPNLKIPLSNCGSLQLRGTMTNMYPLISGGKGCYFCQNEVQGDPLMYINPWWSSLSSPLLPIYCEGPLSTVLLYAEVHFPIPLNPSQTKSTIILKELPS